MRKYRPFGDRLTNGSSCRDQSLNLPAVRVRPELRRRPLGSLRDRAARALRRARRLSALPNPRVVPRLSLADANEGPERDRGDEVASALTISVNSAPPR